MQQSVCILKVAGAFARFRRAWRNVIVGGLLAIAASGGRAADIPFTAVWTAMPNLTVATNNDGVCAPRFSGTLADGRVAFLGGVKPGEGVSRLLLFDPQSNSWQWKAQIPLADTRLFPLSDGRCLVMQTPIPATTRPCATDIYDPATDVYTRKADLSSPPGGWTISFDASHFAELPNKEVYAFGGGGYGGAPFQGFIYNPSNNTWRVGPSGRWLKPKGT